MRLSLDINTLQQRHDKFAATAAEHRKDGRVAEAEKWEEAVQACLDLIETKRRPDRGWGGGDADHMRMMRALRHPKSQPYAPQNPQVAAAAARVLKGEITLMEAGREAGCSYQRVYQVVKRLRTHGQEARQK